MRVQFLSKVVVFASATAFVGVTVLLYFISLKTGSALQLMTFFLYKLFIKLSYPDIEERN